MLPGFPCDVYSRLQESAISQNGVIDYSYRGTDWFTTISLWPRMWEITSTAERKVWWETGLSYFTVPLSQHCQEGLERKAEGGKRVGERKHNRDKQRERGINQQRSRVRENKATGKHRESGTNSNVYFIWGGRCVGSTTLRWCSGPFSGWLCGSPRDKSVMKPDGNNTDHQRKPPASASPDCYFHFSFLPFVSEHKFVPPSLSCWLCLFSDRRWKKISCADSQWAVESLPPDALCLFYHADLLQVGKI